MAVERGERVWSERRRLRLCGDGREESAEPRGGAGEGAGGAGSAAEQEGAGDDGEGGERVSGAAAEAGDHREGPEPDRESDGGAGREEARDAGEHVCEGEPGLRLHLLDAASRRLGATGASERRERAGRTGGARVVRREGEGVAVGAERRAAQSAGAVAGAVAAGVQAGADVHSGRGGRGAGRESHAEHRPDAARALRRQSVHRGELEGGHVQQRERDLPDQVCGRCEYGDADGWCGGWCLDNGSEWCISDGSEWCISDRSEWCFSDRSK